MGNHILVKTAKHSIDTLDILVTFICSNEQMFGFTV